MKTKEAEEAKKKIYRIRLCISQMNEGYKREKTKEEVEEAEEEEEEEDRKPALQRSGENKREQQSE